MALLLLHRSATVSICHSKTRDLPGLTRQADILVAAVGRTAFVDRDMVKPGATVVDVGINRVTDRAEVESLFPPESTRRADFERRGSLVVGDVHPAVADVAGALTPVPGGVGPLTIALLLRNTVTAAKPESRDPCRADRRHRHGQEPRARGVCQARRARPSTPTRWRTARLAPGRRAPRRSSRALEPASDWPTAASIAAPLGHRLQRRCGPPRSRGDRSSRRLQRHRSLVPEPTGDIGLAVADIPLLFETATRATSTW